MQTSFAFDKRWRHRRERWVTPEQHFRPAGYSVDVIPEEAARRFVETHHYAGSLPVTRLCVGLFGPRARLAGVAVFSVPMAQAVLARWTGLGNDGAVELGRFVCDDNVAFNGESFFLARAIPALVREKGTRAILSFADPMERHDAAGLLTKRAHWGTCYQATNALFAGRSTPRTLHLTRDGTVLSERMLSKVRTEDRGWRYGAQQLRDAGAPPRRHGETLASWVRRSLREGPFQRVRHRGNLAYLFGTDAAERRRLADLHGGGQPYPERLASATHTMEVAA